MEQNETTQAPTPVIKKQLPISTPAAIITGAVLIAIALFASRGTPSRGVRMVKNTADQAPALTNITQDAAILAQLGIREDDAVRGDVKNSDIVVIEYSDSDCPFCQRFHQTMTALVEGASPKIAWVYRYFPLNIHPDAENEAVALECVRRIGGNGAFWSYMNTVIDMTLTPEKSTPLLTSLAKDEGVSEKQFTACLSDSTVLAKVQSDSAEAQTLGAQGTPFSVAINVKTGKKTTIPGALPIDQVQKIFSDLLK